MWPLLLKGTIAGSRCVAQSCKWQGEVRLHLFLEGSSLGHLEKWLILQRRYSTFPSSPELRLTCTQQRSCAQIRVHSGPERVVRLVNDLLECAAGAGVKCRCCTLQMSAPWSTKWLQVPSLSSNHGSKVVEFLSPF